MKIAIQRPTVQKAKEIAGAAFLWAGIAFGFVRPTTQTFVLAVNIGTEISMIISVIGLLLALLVIGFMGEKKNVRALFIMHLVFRLLRMVLFLLAFFEMYLPLLSVLYYLLGNMSFAFFIVAWCQYCSESSERKKQSTIQPSILYALSLLLIQLCLPSFWAVLLSITFSIVGTLCLVLGTGTVEEQEIVPAPAKQRRAVFFFFGIILGCLLVFCPRFVSQDTLALILGNAWATVAWAVFIILVVTAVFIYSKVRKRSRVFPPLLIPLLALGLLVPPFLVYGFIGVFPISIIFVVLSTLLVFSSGNPAGKRVFTFWGLTFVFWERSLGLLGYGLGALATAFFINSVHFEVMEVSFGILIVVAIIYTTICLITVTLPERMHERKSSKGGTYARILNGVCGRIAADYSLTPRETEVLFELAQGRNTPYIKKKLVISEGTILSHVNHIHQKLDIHTRQELLDIVQRYLENEPHDHE